LWSKKLRDRTIEIDRLRTTVFDLFNAEIRKKFGGRPYLVIANNDVPDKAFPGGTRLNNRPHGLNEYQAYNQIAVLSALNTSNAHQDFMTRVMGITAAQRSRARIGQLGYQAVGRGTPRR
jgi:hypothetical protein